MAEAEGLETEEAGSVVTLEEKHLPATEEPLVKLLYTPTQPLLGHKHQDGLDGKHNPATDGADPKTSAPQGLQQSVDSDPAGRCGSVKSLCNDSNRHECPICNELFEQYGDHQASSLNCNHTLCHRCVSGIMSRARDPGRLQCPFCRQTSPFPQWEIWRLQEESYGGSVCEPGPALVDSPGHDLHTAPGSQSSCLVRGVRLMRLHFLCCSITVLTLLCFAASSTWWYLHRFD